jgi:hypothetical protein
MSAITSPFTIKRNVKNCPWSNPKKLPVGDLDIGGDQMPYIVAKDEAGVHVWMLLPIDQSVMAFNVMFGNPNPTNNAQQKRHEKDATLLSLTHFQD